MYEMLFDLVTEGPPNTGWLAASAVALAVALAVLWRYRQRGQPTGTPRFFAAAFALVLVVTGLSAWDHHRLSAALREGRTQVVEGPMESHRVLQHADYNPSTKRYDRRTEESFYVGPVPFGFFRDASVPGFTNSGDRPVSFARGQTLRVHYVEDTPGDFASRRILRLERRRPGTAAAANDRGDPLPPRP